MTCTFDRITEFDKMSAADCLDEEQGRQLVFDLEYSREAFVNTLG